MKKIISKILFGFSGRSKNIYVEKTSVRKKIGELKKQIPAVQKQQEANVVFDKIETLPEFKTAKNILLYWSTPDELPTHEIVEKWSAQKQIILPTVVGDNLILKSYSSKEKMKKGSLGIWEPDSSENYTEDIDLVLVPGMAFDIQKNRLGRGKGFYDRFLKSNHSIKIGVGFDFQLLPKIPSEKSDIRMDKIITASHIIE